MLRGFSKKIQTTIIDGRCQLSSTLLYPFFVHLKKKKKQQQLLLLLLIESSKLQFEILVFIFIFWMWEDKKRQIYIISKSWNVVLIVVTVMLSHISIVFWFILLHYGLVWSIQSTSIQLGPFNLLWTLSVHFGLLQSISV